MGTTYQNGHLCARTSGNALLPAVLDPGEVQGHLEEEEEWPSLSGLRAAATRQPGRTVLASGAHHLNVSPASTLFSQSREIYAHTHVSY